MMKRRIVAILTVCVLISGIAYAKRTMWRQTEKPPVSLHLAITLAEAELENEEADYFCIGASLARTFSEGDWELHFSSKDGKEMWVSVGSDRKIKKSKDGFEY